MRALGLFPLQLRPRRLLADRGLALALRIVALALPVMGALVVALPFAQQSLAGTIVGDLG